jgi:hypothetical protein
MSPSLFLLVIPRRRESSDSHKSFAFLLVIPRRRESSDSHKSFAFCSSFPRKRESSDFALAERKQAKALDSRFRGNDEHEG